MKIAKSLLNSNYLSKKNIMPNSYRIRTDLGINKSINVSINQEFEYLEILSLKVLQSEIYTRVCSDYGVIIGRISVNNGFGLPIVIEIPRVKQPIPLFILFRALGIISDKEICEKILLNINDEKNKLLLEALQASTIEANKHLTQEECIKYITSF